jgi:hypothetical protein
MADVAHQDEWWPAVLNRQRPSVALGLATGVEHQHVAGPAGVTDAAGRRFQAGQGWGDERLRSAGLAGLFGFQHEAVKFVEVDAAGAGGSVRGVTLYRALEDVVVFLSAGGGRVGASNVEDVAQFGQEERVVGSFPGRLRGLASGR